MSVVDVSYDNPLKLEETATNPFGGGIANQGYTCGMLWGAALAAGARAYQLHGAGAKAESKAIIATKKLVETFRSKTKNEINCMEIIELDMQSPKGLFKFLIKGGPIRCFSLASKYAKAAFDELNDSFAEEHDTHPDLPISCTSVFAKKLGLTDEQVTMAAGLAGGIGFSGGACGVYGVAIWAYGLKNPDDVVRFMPTDPWVGKLTERFFKSSDFEFECSNIVGRKFESVGDHASYVCSGGCSKIIEAMAAE